jgi:hypothetical protein
MTLIRWWWHWCGWDSPMGPFAGGVLAAATFIVPLLVIATILA